VGKSSQATFRLGATCSHGSPRAPNGEAALIERQERGGKHRGRYRLSIVEST